MCTIITIITVIIDINVQKMLMCTLVKCVLDAFTIAQQVHTHTRIQDQCKCNALYISVR